jgi:hypothetical protein
MKMKDKLLNLPITDAIFCLIIDTYNAHDIWKDVFGHGKFSKISKISVSEDFGIKNIELLDESIRKYIILSTFEDNYNEERICDLEINLNEHDFNSHEKQSIKKIIDIW